MFKEKEGGEVVGILVALTDVVEKLLKLWWLFKDTKKKKIGQSMTVRVLSPALEQTYNPRAASPFFPAQFQMGTQLLV